MINKIISAVCTQLYNEFGDDYDIYKESIKQGLQEPCFFVQVIAPLHDRQSPKRIQRHVTVSVQYFPKSEDYYLEDNAVLERLYSCLEEITVDECIIRGADIESSIPNEDGVLNYSITYIIFEYDSSTDNVMEDYTETTYIKE